MNRYLIMFLKLMQFAFLTAIVLAGYALLQMAHIQVDATEEKLVQLSDETVALIEKLDPEKPVRIRAYFSNDLPRDLGETRANLINFLNGIERISGGKVRVKITYLDADSQAAADVERLFNLKARPMIERGSGNPRPLKVYMSLIFSCGLKERIIPFFERGMSEELELVRNIKVVNGGTLNRIGVLGTDSHVWGQTNFQTFEQSEPWRFIQELQKQYEVLRLTPENLRRYYYDGGNQLKQDEKISVLIIPMASTLTERELYYLHQYVWTGAPVLILDDPWPTVDHRLAPALPKRPPMDTGMPPNMGDQPPKGKIEAFFQAMGVEWKSQETVWATYNPYPILPIDSQHIFFLGRRVPEISADDRSARITDCFNAEDETTAHLQELLMFVPGGISKSDAPPAGIQITPLLSSPPTCGRHTVQELVPQAFAKTAEEAARIPPPLSFFADKSEPIILAARINGPMRNAYPNGLPPATGDSAAADPDADSYADPAKQPPAAEGGLSKAAINVIFIPDIDMITNQFFDLRDQMPDFDGVRLDLDNTRFVLNCVDSLAGDKTYLNLRNRRPIHRPMERMDSLRNGMLASMATEFNAAKKQAEAETTAANARVKKMLDDIQSSKLDLAAKNAKIEKDWKNEETVNKKYVEKLQQDLARRRAELERETRTVIEQIRLFVLIWPIVIPVSLILTIGLAVLIVKTMRERTEVPSARRRQ